MAHQRIEMTDVQKEAVGQVMADATGANIQSGIRENGLIYIAWQYDPNMPSKWAHVDPQGTVTYD